VKGEEQKKKKQIHLPRKHRNTIHYGNKKDASSNVKKAKSK